MRQKSRSSSAEYDLGYVSAALPLLQSYLLSPELYWSLATKPPAGSPPYPELTLGSLLLALARLKARRHSVEQQTNLIRLEGELNQIRSGWRVAWEKKAQRSFSSRLKMWGNFIEEYRANPESHYDRYAYEIRHRVMLELLAGEAGSVPEAERELQSGLDKILRAVFVPGEFVWDEELAGGFPPETYWYLYGRLQRG